MFSIKPDFSFDAGIPLWANIFGIGYAVLSFAIAVFLEAKMMKGYLEIDHCLISFQRRIKFSFLANTVSTILGLPLVYMAGVGNYRLTILDQIIAMMMVFTASAIYPFFIMAAYSKWLIYAFILSVVAEAATLLLVIRQKQSMMRILVFAVLSNIASYAVIILLPTAFWLLAVLVAALTSTR